MAENQAPESITVRFVEERETKNSILFQEEPATMTTPTYIGALYVRKDTLRALDVKGPKRTLRITIERG